MSGALTAIALIDALLSLSINALMAAQKAQLIIGRARNENRDVNDAELTELQALNKTLTDETLAVLKAAAAK